MQLPRMTGVQTILGFVMLFALVPKVSLALAMRECIKRHNFGCNTESRGFLLPARAPTLKNHTTGELHSIDFPFVLNATNSGNIDNGTIGVGTFPLHTCLFSFLRTMLGVA